MSYQPNIPTGPENLDNDYLNLRQNFQALDTVYKIDHVALTSSSGTKGYHKLVHLVNYASGDPAAAASTGILYCKTVDDGYSTDTQLYFKTKNDLKLILTNNFLPLASQNGYTFLPGGLLLQWGRIVTGASNNQKKVDVTFTGISLKAFPNNNFGGWANMQRDSNDIDTVYLYNFSKTGFSYRNTSSSSKTFNFIFIGN